MVGGEVYAKPTSSTQMDAPQPQRSPVTASSSRIQSSPSPISSHKQLTSTVQSMVTGTDLDNFDLIACTVNRKNETQSLGFT